MKTLLLSIGLCLTLKAAEKPNFILIYTDDLGYNDLSCYGSKKIKTPHIDTLAKNGIKLLDYYATSASCTPSRAALMTGSYPGRVGLNNVLMPDSKDKHTGKTLGLNPDELTIAEVVKAQGYATACIGKWHLGDDPIFMPNNHGFDYYFGIPYSNDMIPPRFPDLPLIKNSEILELNPDQDYLTQRLTDEALKFIERKKDQPFFLYLAHPMPHRACHASPEFMKNLPPEKVEKIKPGDDKKSRDFIYPASVEEIDWSTGKIITKLKELNLEENTIVIFTSDNGPKVGSASPLSGKKGSVLEGGHRVPAIIQWKGKIPVGTESKSIITGMDLLPTFAHLSGHTLPENLTIDGLNITPQLLNPTNESLSNRTFFYNHGGIAVRQGKWKLIRGKKGKLINLKQDISERTDLSEQHPEIAQKLNDLITKFQTDIKENGREPGSLEPSK